MCSSDLNEPVRPSHRNKPPGLAQVLGSAARAAGKQDQPSDDWRDLAVAMTRTIRDQDPDSVIIFEPSPWGLPKGFSDLTPLPFSGVVYSFHFYEPHALTPRSGQPSGRDQLSQPDHIAS